VIAIGNSPVNLASVYVPQHTSAGQGKLPPAQAKRKEELSCALVNSQEYRDNAKMERGMARAANVQAEGKRQRAAGLMPAVQSPAGINPAAR
jgi:hypothetical protein